MNDSSVSHDQQVNQQFGQAAAAYLTSSVHAQGADLQRLSASFKDRSSAHVLDVGCGAGHVSFAIAPHVATMVAADLSSEMLEVVQQEAARRGISNLHTRQGVAESLPFADASFDHVVTRFSAHHWSDLPRALREIKRVLKPGGGFTMIDTMAPAQPLFDTHLQTVELLRDVSHVRNYAFAEWQRHFETAGFQIGASDQWKLPLDFQTWIQRMQTPPERVAVIRGLLGNAPQEVRDYLAVQEDLSFSLDVVMFDVSVLQA